MIHYVLAIGGMYKLIQWATDEVFPGTEYPPAFRRELINAHWKENKGWCPGCEKVVRRRDLTVDHIVPINKDGKNSRNNAQVLCRPCNCSKQDKVSLLDRFVGRGGDESGQRRRR